MEVKVEVKASPHPSPVGEGEVSPFRGRFRGGSPKLSSSQLAGLTSCAKRITSILTTSYNSPNLNLLNLIIFSDKDTIKMKKQKNE